MGRPDLKGGTDRGRLLAPSVRARARTPCWRHRGQDGAVTVVRINAITVPDEGGDELARRFAERAGAVDSAAGFEGFELLRPTDGRAAWLVVTRWRDAAAFEAWVASPAFAQGHRGVSSTAHPERPVAAHSELWSYDIELAVSHTGSAGQPGS